jgi:hypothetical protein
MKRKLLPSLCAVAALAVWATPAAADPSAGPKICSSAGTAVSGTYGNLTIRGNAYVRQGTTLTVRHNLEVAQGSCLDAFTLGTVRVRNNVLVDRKAILALGCTPASIGPTPPCNNDTTNDTVDGSIIATSPLTMYLDGDTIHGSVVSTGGGPGPTMDPYVNFPIKDNVIDGNLIVHGWQGTWFGALRDTVGQDMVITNNVGVAIGEFGPDSTEIATNTVSGNLICLDNNPPAQFGDSGGLPNTVGGHKIGQCAGL